MCDTHAAGLVPDSNMSISILTPLSIVPAEQKKRIEGAPSSRGSKFYQSQVWV